MDSCNNWFFSIFLSIFPFYNLLCTFSCTARQPWHHDYKYQTSSDGREYNLHWLNDYGFFRAWGKLSLYTDVRLFALMSTKEDWFRLKGFAHKNVKLFSLELSSFTFSRKCLWKYEQLSFIYICQLRGFGKYITIWKIIFNSSSQQKLFHAIPILSSRSHISISEGSREA